MQGEKTLAQHMADASKGLGMFDVLNGFEDAAALSEALKARVAKY